jgi:hypothetical protein
MGTPPCPLATSDRTAVPAGQCQSTDGWVVTPPLRKTSHGWRVGGRMTLPKRVTSGSRGDAHHRGKQRNSLASTIGSACLLPTLGPSVARQLCANYVSYYALITPLLYCTYMYDYYCSQLAPFFRSSPKGNDDHLYLRHPRRFYDLPL